MPRLPMQYAHEYRRMNMIDLNKVEEVLERARKAAIDYYDLTRKPLGITGELREYIAAKILGLELVDARFPGYDAIDSNGRKIQIKTRRIPLQRKSSDQVGSIYLKHEWDCVILVLLDERFEPREIHEAERMDLEVALTKPGSKARNERGSLAVSKFIALGRKLWPNSAR